MKLAVHANYFLDEYGVQDGMKRIRDLGYRYISYSITGRYDEPFVTQWSEEDLKNYFTPIREAAQANGITIAYTHLKGDYYNDFSPHTFEARKKMCHRAVLATHYLGVEMLGVRPVALNVPDPNSMELSRRVCYEVFDLLTQAAAELGVRIAVINPNRIKTSYCYGNTIDELKEICQHYDAPLIFDPLNAYFTHIPYRRFMQELKDRFFAFVMDDLEPLTRSRTVPMLGSVNYSVIFSEMYDMPEDLVVSVDASPILEKYKTFSEDKALEDAVNQLLLDMGEEFIHTMQVRKEQSRV